MHDLSNLHPQVVQTLEDHHQEVLSLYRDYGFSGLIAQDSEFALCNVPAYFSSHALKLSWNGKNLTTHQYLLSEAARQLGLKTQHLPLFAALLGEGGLIKRLLPRCCSVAERKYDFRRRSPTTIG